MAAWYEDDDFWETWEPYLFSAQRLQKTPAEVDALVSHLELAAGASVLDLCCGVGRHSLEFARRGFVVTGVDRTRTYLDRCRAQAQVERLDVKFIESDARAFRSTATFDGAINMYTSFGYFEDPADDLRVAENVYESLKPGARLVLEMSGKEILARTFQERAWTENEDGSFCLEERRIRGGWDGVDSRWILLRDGKIWDGTVSTRSYGGSDHSNLLKRAGFNGVSLLGNLAGAPYDQNAERLIAVASK